MSNYPFPHLRSAYLKFIAATWAIRDREGEKAYRARLENLVARDGGILPILRNEYGLNFTWQVCLKIATGEAQPEWDSQREMWVGTEDAFTIYIPSAPRPEVQAQLLANYYMLRPTILGSGGADSSTEQQDPEQVRRHSQNEGAPADPIPDSFTEFGIVTMRAIARAWQNEKFRKLLTGHGKDLPVDARECLQAYMDYMVPWNFKLYFKECGDDLERLPPNEITLYFPDKPEDPRIEATALAAYNGTGPQYPFTCG